MRKIKVLFLTNIPSPYRVDFFNELGKRCELTVTFEGRRATDRNRNWISGDSQSYQTIYLKGKRISNDSFFCPGIISVLKRHWDKIIIGVYASPTSMLAIEYMKWKGQKFYIEADGGIIQKDNSLKYRLKHHLISSASGWLSSGERTTDYLVHYGADRARCHLYPFTSLTKTDLGHADWMGETDKKHYKEAIGVKEEKMLLTVGRFSHGNWHRKGYDTLMRTAEKLNSNVGIYIVGDNPTGEFLEWKERNGLEHVHFVGFKTKEELRTYYAAADLFVLMTRYDIWGLVINEAMSFRLPIITTDKCVAGLELVKDGVNGYIVPVDDDGALAERVMSIIDDEGMLRYFGGKSREMIQRYSIEDMAEEHAKILEL